MKKSYTELIRLKTFEERFHYLQLDNVVGESIFGHDRYLNQKFYKSEEWLEIRDYCIVRDLGSDLAMGEDFEIFDMIIVHHIIPITKEMLLRRDPLLYDPNNLICCSALTHKAIHYGDISLIQSNDPIVRRPGDTSPWLS